MTLLGWFPLEKQLLSKLSNAHKLKFTGTLLAHIVRIVAIKIKYGGRQRKMNSKRWTDHMLFPRLHYNDSKIMLKKIWAPKGKKRAAEKTEVDESSKTFESQCKWLKTDRLLKSPLAYTEAPSPCIQASVLLGRKAES